MIILRYIIKYDLFVPLFCGLQTIIKKNLNNLKDNSNQMLFKLINKPINHKLFHD